MGGRKKCFLRVGFSGLCGCILFDVDVDVGETLGAFVVVCCCLFGLLTRWGSCSCHISVVVTYL